MQSYREFLRNKTRKPSTSKMTGGFGGPLFDFQAEIVDRAKSAGRYSIFADCGLGKSIMELEWASAVPGRTLLLAPLAVSHQLEAEAARFGYDARVSADGPSDAQITITNYHKLHRFNPSDFEGVVLDESSILKSHDGKTRTSIIEAFSGHKYRLAATATPSPNDYMELGNHAEFMGAMTRAEMLSMFFVHDGGSTQKWRLKGHAESDFWRWVGRWSCAIRSPADLGFDGSRFQLPDLRVHHEVVPGGEFADGSLIPGVVSLDIHARRKARRMSLGRRVERCVSVDNGGQFLAWCDLNDESQALSKALSDAAEVTGSTPDEAKTAALLGFAAADVRCLVTKPKIAGFGMNWQACSRMAFVGLSDSYESFYQATRRCWRFGQTEPVDVFLIYSEPEIAVVRNILEKERAHDHLQNSMIGEMQNA